MKAVFDAVFSEQGTSASHQAAYKLLDAIGRRPGNDGQDADATGAYTQVSLKEIHRKLIAWGGPLPTVNSSRLGSVCLHITARNGGMTSTTTRLSFAR